MKIDMPDFKTNENSYFFIIHVNRDGQSPDRPRFL